MIYTRKLLEECERNPALAKFRGILAEHAEMAELLEEIYQDGIIPIEQIYQIGRLLDRMEDK